MQIDGSGGAAGLSIEQPVVQRHAKSEGKRFDIGKFGGPGVLWKDRNRTEHRLFEIRRVPGEFDTEDPGQTEEPGADLLVDADLPTDQSAFWTGFEGVAGKSEELSDREIPVHITPAPAGVGADIDATPVPDQWRQIWQRGRGRPLDRVVCGTSR